MAPSVPRVMFEGELECAGTGWKRRLTCMRPAFFGCKPAMCEAEPFLSCQQAPFGNKKRFAWEHDGLENQKRERMAAALTDEDALDIMERMDRVRQDRKKAGLSVAEQERAVVGLFMSDEGESVAAMRRIFASDTWESRLMLGRLLGSIFNESEGSCKRHLRGDALREYYAAKARWHATDANLAAGVAAGLAANEEAVRAQCKRAMQATSAH